MYKITYKFFFSSARVSSISQSGSLSLFSSKEQELEQRALLLKRLAFVIFCSEKDQYQKQMPDIQGKRKLFKTSLNLSINILLFPFFSQRD